MIFCVLMCPLCLRGSPSTSFRMTTTEARSSWRCRRVSMMVVLRQASGWQPRRHEFMRCTESSAMVVLRLAQDDNHGDTGVHGDARRVSMWYPSTSFRMTTTEARSSWRCTESFDDGSPSTSFRMTTTEVRSSWRSRRVSRWWSFD